MRGESMNLLLIYKYSYRAALLAALVALWATNIPVAGCLTAAVILKAAADWRMAIELKKAMEAIKDAIDKARKEETKGE